MAEKQIFRQVSLERLSSPEQLDLLMKVTQPKSWLALFGVGCLLAAALVWGIVGRIPIEINAPAIILPEGGIKTIPALSDGQITALNVTSGDLIEANQIIGEITPLGQTAPESIISPFNGRVVELKTGHGHLINFGTAIMNLEPVEAESTLQAIMYIPRTDAQQLQQDMVVKLASESAQMEQYGYLLGRVAFIGDFPVTQQGIASKVGSEELANLFANINSPIEIRIALLTDTNTPSGLKWTTSTGPDYTLGTGSLASATIIIDQQRPLNLFLAK